MITIPESLQTAYLVCLGIFAVIALLCLLLDWVDGPAWEWLIADDPEDVMLRYARENAEAADRIKAQLSR